MHKNKYDTIILGAGAAGLMCAWLTASRGRSVLLLDHSHKLAEKIRISGGGRCNFTNINTSQDCYISHNPNFMVSALARYTPHNFMELLDKYNIKYHEKTLGQMFCDGSSGEIIAMLDALCKQHQVTRIMGCKVKYIGTGSTSGYIVDTSCGLWESENLVISTGGLSIPKIGATNFGYEVAKQFGLNIIKPKPALVPLTLSERELAIFGNLAGISSYVRVGTTVCTNNKPAHAISFLENALITHRGLSGPAILQISSYWEPGSALTLDLLPHIVSLAEHIHIAKKNNPQLNNFLRSFISERLANVICEQLRLNKPLATLSKSDIQLLERNLHNVVIVPSGTEGYKKAEVTCGGVDTDELSSKTMMAKNVPGLYFIGEVVDVTGWLGGYNFQWAWASAYACAMSV